MFLGEKIYIKANNKTKNRMEIDYMQSIKTVTTKKLKNCS